MHLGDWIAAAVIVLLVIFAIRAMKRDKSSCDGNCARCQSGCTSIDWEQIRKDIHEGR